MGLAEHVVDAELLFDKTLAFVGFSLAPSVDGAGMGSLWVMRTNA